MVFSEADKGGGAGGSAAPSGDDKPTAQGGNTSPFDAAEAPKIEGDSLETRVTNAGNLISRLFAAGKDLVSRLSTATNENTKLENQFNAATTDLQSEKDAHTKTQGELATAKTTITGLTAERDNANKSVARLEKLCGLRGIDTRDTVPAADAPGGGNSKKAEHQSLLEKENKGEVPTGTAHRFYRKNKKDIDG
jgi:chromosome segregation ATPase